MTSISKLLCSAAALIFLALTGIAPAAAQTWNFRVLLDNAPIGAHHYKVSETDGVKEATQDAQFAVKVLFVTAYQYTFKGTEHWQAGCVKDINASTNDNGEKLEVKASRDGDKLAVTATKSKHTLDGCVMSFAYWNPDILRQQKLLNPQTGEYEAIKVADVGHEQITVKGASVNAHHYKITGPKNPLDLWYSDDGVWLQLDSSVAGGRKLQYRQE